MDKIPKGNHPHANKVHFENVPETPPRPSRDTSPSQITTYFTHSLRDAESDPLQNITHKLHVSNLPDEATFADLQKLFPTAISVVLEHLPNTKKTATVEFSDAKHYHEALKQNTMTKFKGKLLVVSPKADM